MADGGELAAAFRALAEDAAQAGEDVGSSIGKWFDDTADIEDENVTRTLAADSENARALNAIRPNADTGAPGDGAGGGAADGAGSSGENRISRLLSGDDDGASAPGQTGGTMRPRLDGTIRSYELDDKWATDAYESIRSADDVEDIASNVRDVPRLDGSTGFTPEEIQTVKDHVFFDEHPLAGIDGGIVTSRFDSSPDMAEAWLRLRAGTFKPQDTVLLEHELAENRYWQQHPGAIYQEAHRAANQVANWERDIPETSREDYSKPWR